MRIVGQVYRRLACLIRRRRYAEDLREEMEVHRQMMGDRTRFGNTLRLREEADDVWGWNWLDAFARDIREGLRSLRKSPGVAVTSMLILSVGIGANLAFYQLLNEQLLQPPDVRDPASLVRFERMWRDTTRNRTTISSNVPYPMVQALASRTGDILTAALTQLTDRRLVWEQDVAPVTGRFVSANYFEELGYEAVQGRLFREETDEASNSDPSIVVGYRFWQNRLGADPGIIGTTVRVNNRPAVVIGVAPDGYIGLGDTGGYQNLWLPLDRFDYFNPGSTLLTGWAGGPEMFGRLGQGVNAAIAEERLRMAMNELAAEYPAGVRAGEWLEPYLGTDRFRTPGQSQDRALMIAFLAVLAISLLIITCANLSGVVLARWLGRLRELGIRTALGAGRWQTIRHLVVESALLSLAGAIGGTLLGYWLINGPAMSGDLPLQGWAMTPATILGTVATVFLALTTVGLIPAWRISHQDLSAVIKDGGQQASRALSRVRMRQVLIAAQVACSCVLLIVAGLYLRGWQRMVTDPGYDFANVAVLDASLGRAGVDGEGARAFWVDIKNTLALEPEVESLSLISNPPLGNGLTTRDYPDVPNVEVTVSAIEPDFFEVMRIPILLGSTFSGSEDAQTSVIISRRLAIQMYGQLDVVGQPFPRTNPEQIIVGIADDARLIRLDRLDDAELYTPVDPEQMAGMRLVVRARNSAELLLPRMRQAVQSYNERILPNAGLLEEDFSFQTTEQRQVSAIVTSIAAFGLFLACLGIFGVVSYLANLRRKEIGIRLALGASRRSVMRLLTIQFSAPTLVGILIGMVTGTLVGRVIETQARSVRALDPPVLALVVVVLVGSAGIAAILPTLRATRGGIMTALRVE